MKKRIILISGVLILLIVAGLFFAMYRARANTPPDKVVSRFFNTWIEEMKNGSNVPFDKQLYKKSTYVTKAFGTSVESSWKDGMNVVTCTNTVPEKFEIDAVNMNDKKTRATVFVRLDSRILRVLTARVDGWWKIDEVECPSS